jgi:putative spermidine/putrescine transport system permease protein
VNPGGAGALGAGSLLQEIEDSGAPAPGQRRLFRGGGGRGRRPQAWRLIILIAALIYFVGPLIASIKYSLVETSGSYGGQNYADIITNTDLRDSLFKSLEIAGITAVVVVSLMLPTVVLVRLRFPKLTLLLEGVTILPIVVPPIVIAAGMAQLQSSAPSWMVSLWFNHPITGLAPIYVILTMPFTYRAIDTGVRAIDLRTLVDASRSLGGSWFSTLVRVILPNVETAVLGAVFLAIAMCLGEVVISTILLYNTLPVQMIQVGESSPGVSVALSVASILFVFLVLFGLSFLAGRRRGAISVRVV